MISKKKATSSESTANSTVEPPYISPRDFMRKQRPEKFSDSVEGTEPTLDRTTLEYHLSTITSRSQELLFESFARKLLEHEICPNLLPHTGPTGGGDSKVDSETYPVAEELALGWHVGVTSAASERWAFAFSAKADWRDKVRSDIEKVINTNRGYKKAFFLSNQFIKDKDRAAIEDELRAKYKIDVRIFDRTWILDRVFTGHHENLAVEELDLPQSLRRIIHKGPNDIAREKELQELEEHIQAGLRESRHTFQLVNDCVDIALLARGLERPRTEIDGYFIRAERFANKIGTSHQQLSSIYQYAWTVFWWFEDYELFPDLYVKVEKLAQGTSNIYELELLSNLWRLLQRIAHEGKANKDGLKFSEHTEILITELQRVAADINRPSTSLQAKTLLLLIKLDPSDESSISTILEQLKDIVHASEGLVGYPLQPLVKILSEFGNVLSDLPAFDELFELIISTVKDRDGEVSAGNLLFKRGQQQLVQDRPYGAIKNLGRALTQLYKHETRQGIIRVLCLCGNAYQRVGLLWAARGSFLTAASIAINEFWTYEKITPDQAVCFNQVKWLELQLGRVPHVLAWHELDQIVQAILKERGYNLEHLFHNDEAIFDASLGILFLKTEIATLPELEKIPDVLEKPSIRLYMAEVALLYALGYEDGIPEELLKYAEDGSKDVLKIFTKWRDQPAYEELPSGAMKTTTENISFQSNLLGCHISVTAENNSPCIELGESFLAALESLFSTAHLEKIIAREPELIVKISKSASCESPFSFDLKHVEGRPCLEIVTTIFNPYTLSITAQEAIKKKLSNCLFTVIGHVFLINDVEATLTRLFRDERAVDRAINFTSSFVVLGNVLGHQPKLTLNDWCADTKAYPLLRKEPWDHQSPRAVPQPKPLRTGSGAAPEKLLDPESSRHDQIKVISLIREPLWQKAQWEGTAFLVSSDLNEIPIIAPIFRNSDAANKIFSLWQKELGKDDSKNKLRLSIIRGIMKDRPYAYRVLVTSNLNRESSQSSSGLIVTIGQPCTMVPTSDKNLKMFLDRYQRLGRYLIMPASIEAGGQTPVANHNLAIGKTELNICEAWAIGLNDLDSMGIREEDQVIIPDGVSNPPIQELLNWRKDRKKP